MPYNFVADSFRTQKKLCTRLSFKQSAILDGKRPFCVFEPPFKGLRDNVRCSYRAHWKARSGLPISVNWTFFAIGVTAEALRAKLDRKLANSLQNGHLDPKFQVEGVAPTNHFCTDSWANDYNFAADSSHTTKLCSRLSSSQVRF